MSSQTDRQIQVGSAYFGFDRPFSLIAGPCVVEQASLTFDIAAKLKAITEELGMGFVFKASVDKANRTTHSSFRGLGVEKGLAILEDIKKRLSLPVITDVHDKEGLQEIASVVDVLQTPAFLCRQTDFIQAVARCGKPMNVKKGQFMSPWDMKHVVDKIKAVGHDQIMVCERGVSFGYQNLVADMRSLMIMRETGCPVVFDATHSVQLPGAGQGCSSGQREMIPVLAKAAVGAGVSGIFMETHPHPEKALSDGPNSWPLAQMHNLLTLLQKIDACVKTHQQYSDELVRE
jgi:2-dehydro-3-deoxyphosphooctonate aldolase (KDO 8-P synthase)